MIQENILHFHQMNDPIMINNFSYRRYCLFFIVTWWNMVVLYSHNNKHIMINESQLADDLQALLVYAENPKQLRAQFGSYVHRYYKGYKERRILISELFSKILNNKAKKDIKRRKILLNQPPKQALEHLCEAFPHLFTHEACFFTDNHPYVVDIEKLIAIGFILADYFDGLKHSILAEKLIGLLRTLNRSQRTVMAWIMDLPLSEHAWKTFYREIFSYWKDESGKEQAGELLLATLNEGKDSLLVFGEEVIRKLFTYNQLETWRKSFIKALADSYIKHSIQNKRKEQDRYLHVLGNIPSVYASIQKELLQVKHMPEQVKALWRNFMPPQS